MAKNTVKRPFTLTLDDGKQVSYNAGDTLDKAHADHWYAKAHCDQAADDAAKQQDDAAAAVEAQKQAETQKQAEAATKAGDTVRASTKG